MTKCLVVSTDGSHKVIDVRLSGRYNGSLVVPFNASLEEARRKYVSKLASESGQAFHRKQRSLLQRTGARRNEAGEAGRSGESGMQVRGASEGLTDELNRRAGVSEVKLKEGMGRTAARTLRKLREDDRDGERLSVTELSGTGTGSETGRKGVLHLGTRQGTGRSAQAERSVIDEARGLSMQNRVSADSQFVGTGAGNGERLDSHSTGAKRSPAGRLQRTKEGRNWIETGRELVASHQGAARLLQAGGEKADGERFKGVRDVVTLGKDGNALTVVTRPHPRTRLRNLVFGIAATAATWSERKEILRLWWDARRLRGYVWMDTPDLTGNNCTKSVTSGEGRPESPPESSRALIVSLGSFRLTH